MVPTLTNEHYFTVIHMRGIHNGRMQLILICCITNVTWGGRQHSLLLQYALLYPVEGKVVHVAVNNLKATDADVKQAILMLSGGLHTY
ncbi:hypothetical protein Pmani_023518 [Petrolisthes manimaculis]|uniref:Uncharacterized protein n=1 Tax=Petrolisthes manimaculis TaxID=1843537 RepID=A0AAE1PC32_9EUCA|nr:hypothetical protein Pmani_023518 [Petrolisthes manimaculis]